MSTIGVTSFFPSKPLGCYGDGGACFTNNDDLATKIRAIKNNAITTEKSITPTLVGMNLLMKKIIGLQISSII